MYERAPFKLTGELLEALGGSDSDGFAAFAAAAAAGYAALRSRALDFRCVADSSAALIHSSLGIYSEFIHYSLGIFPAFAHHNSLGIHSAFTRSPLGIFSPFTLVGEPLRGVNRADSAAPRVLQPQLRVLQPQVQQVQQVRVSQ